jgi:hypothetical protein
VMYSEYRTPEGIRRIARIMGNPEVDPGGPEVGLEEITINLLEARFWTASVLADTRPCFTALTSL